MSEKKFITTPIYYVNDIPHIGHAYTTIAADVLSRYYRAQGKEVFFLTGTDEHGAKIAEAAEKSAKTPKEFVDSLVPKFKNAWQKIDISYDQFFRTTDPEHEKVVKEFVKRLIDANCIVKKQYEGLYCTGCERFYQPDEVVDGKCPDHNRELEIKKEENYFFKLSEFSDKLLNAIEKGEYQILPESRKNEVVGKIKQGLEDVSISRGEVSWGITYPGDDKQTIYVWVDALINYWSATIIYKNQKSKVKSQNDGEERHPEWPADLHLMAKDILWFHAIIWPAMLLAVGEKLPKKIFAHGFFTIDGKKMSKSLGNVLDPVALADKYGADALRYCLLREFPFGEDGDISEEKIALRYQSDLANGLGNLLNRTLNMIDRYQIPNDKFLISNEMSKFKSKNLEGLKFDQDLQDMWEGIARQNELIDKKKPWQLAKENKIDELEEVLSIVFRFLTSLIPRLFPYMPKTAVEMKKQLETLTPEPLFQRINNE